MKQLIYEIKKTFLLLETLFSSEELVSFLYTPNKELELYHFGFGTWIRNNLIYSKNSILYPLFIENGIVSTDDMSSIIIDLFHEYLIAKHR